MTSDEVLATPGVAFNAPPAELLPSITAIVTSATANLKPGSSGALVGVVTGEGDKKSGNAAIVQKFGDKVAVVAWVGKRWDSGVVWGAAVKAEW